MPGLHPLSPFQGSLSELGEHKELPMLLSLCCVFLAVFLAFLGAMPVPALADDSAAVAPMSHEDVIKTPAGKFVQSLGDRAISIIADKTITAQQRADKFRAILGDSFDLMTIGRFVIGRTWNTATPEQQSEYMRLFKELVVKSYGDRLTLYTGEGFRVISSRPESEKDFIVNSQITHPDGSAPTSIDWRIRQRDGKFGVIDVVVEGVSLSVTQRQEYSAIIQRDGGQISGLLDMMRKQLGAPAAGQPG